MTKKRAVLPWLVVATLFASTNAFGLGLGVYFEGAGGTLDWKVEDDFGNEIDVDGDSKKAAFGFVLDTAVAANTVFNYRLNVGLTRFDADFDGDDETLEMGGIAVDNTFGFAVYRSELVRLWLGPQLRIAYYHGEFEDSGFEVDIAEVGIAPVVGVNLNFGRTFTLAFSGGYRFLGYGGTDEDDEDIRGSGREAFGNLSLLFRLGDDRWR